jgi:hypothetical protein
VLTGCPKVDWTRPGATLQDFAGDHRECLETTGAPLANEPGYVIAWEPNFKQCLAARGWRRQDFRDWEVPRGYYRGLEELDLAPVAVTTLPKQPGWTAETAITPRPTGERINCQTPGADLKDERCRRGGVRPR